LYRNGRLANLGDFPKRLFVAANSSVHGWVENRQKARKVSIETALRLARSPQPAFHKPDVGLMEFDPIGQALPAKLLRLSLVLAAQVFFCKMV